MQSYFILTRHDGVWEVREFEHTGLNNPFKEALECRARYIRKNYYAPKDVVVAHGMAMYDDLEADHKE